ncbi:MAG: flagellar filament capping protein FliD [Acidobacteria bacterium]|nr:flagellar filament capping protein FliD [Acidobacteriota bacterium]MDA1234549.1 flagellar filament capping protein FliD [Acidobacteriota bacterium]
MSAGIPVSFVGVSKFSENFQVLLERSFTVANLPVKNLQTEQTIQLAKQQEFGNLAADVRALRDAFATLGVRAAQGAIAASSSDSSVATVVLTGTPGAISFDLDVTSAAASAQETSTSSVADSAVDTLAADGIFTLTVGSQVTAIDLTQPGLDNTLEGLRDHINSSGLGVQATIINTSSDLKNPEYHLTLTANDTGATTLSLTDSGAQELLTQVNQGTDAVFTVNGVAVTNSGNTIVDFAPGLSLTIVDAGTVTVAAKADITSLSSALSAVATQYNAVVSRVVSHIGDGAGVLSGDSLIRETQSALRELTGRLGDGSVFSMADLGLELDDQGALGFDAAKFSTIAGSDFVGVLHFLGDTTSGFAGAAHTRLSNLSDPVTGHIQTAIQFLRESDKNLQAQIEKAQERVDLLIKNLEDRFAAADVLLAALESQQDLLTQLFQPINNNN